MPRSSGGGSHRSGGSRRSSGGGSHRSGSSRRSSGGGSHYSRSRSGSSYGRSVQRVSRRSFSGGRQYVRYRKGTPEYVYANYDITESYTGGGVLILFRMVMTILMCVVGGFTFILFLGGILMLKPPKKITASYDNSIRIFDQAEVMHDMDVLYESMENFYEETGITPCVMTVHNEEWQEYYDGLESYAYDLYVNHFQDEYHWLIVYSEPEEVNPDFNDWYFEGMIGENTDSLITHSVENHFNELLQEGFTNRQISVEQAIADAFDLAAKESLDDSGHGLSALLFVIPFAVIFVILIILNNKISAGIRKKYAQFKPVPENTRIERNCEYCNGMYIAGTVLECPHCGAPIPAETEKRLQE